jgi:ATP-dependent DNA helicase
MTSSSVAATDSASQKSTPASSPPPLDMEGDNGGISKAMQAEEKRMRAQREEDDKQRNAELEKEREADLESGKEVLDKKFQQLEFLMNKSKVSWLAKLH